MRKFCEETGWRFGQLIANLTHNINGAFDPFYVSDQRLSQEFSKLWNKRKQYRVRNVDSLCRRTVVMSTLAAETVALRSNAEKVKVIVNANPR